MSIHIDIPTPEFNHPAELAMIAKLRDHGEELLAQYLAKETRNGVSFIARDAAKRVFSEYRDDPVGNNRYSDRAASALADAARRYLLSKSPIPPRNEVIIFTGAPASGKSAAGRPIDIKTVEIVHETIFTSVEKPRSFIHEALRAGRRPAISLVYTNDPRINVRRMIERARRIGRTVPLAFMAKAWVEVPRIVAQLHVAFGASVPIALSDNSRTPDQVIRHYDIGRVLDIVEEYTLFSSCLEVMDDELAQINRLDAIPAGILHEARLR